MTQNINYSHPRVLYKHNTQRLRTNRRSLPQSYLSFALIVKTHDLELNYNPTFTLPTLAIGVKLGQCAGDTYRANRMTGEPFVLTT